jgi:ribonuclease D
MSAGAAAGHERLPELASAAREAHRIALDTEFMGEGRYRTLLCLMQLAVPDDEAKAEEILILDPLEDGVDPAPLLEVLADPDVEIIVHAGRQDIALIRRRFGAEVTNVFDTQVAAGFAGLSAQASYESLLADVLGLRVAKTASFTRWDQRPLSEEQLSYAREDVVHLVSLAAELQRRLAGNGRLAWAREECLALCQSSDERDVETILSRLPRSSGLSAVSRPIARELVRWRERTAERIDRPVQSVLGDAALIEIARRRPGSRAELAKIRGIGAAAGARRAEELVEVVEHGRSLPPDPAPERARTPCPRPEEAPLIALAEALLRARAREARLAYELLAARADLQAIVAARRSGQEADVRTLRGWRMELVGRELLELLDGRISLTVENDGSGPRLGIAPR